MKRVGNLWPQFVSFPNLLRSAHKARRGKRSRPSVCQFDFHLEPELWRLHDELVAGTYRPGPYRSFKIFEPKERVISAAPYRDRIVHHALTATLDPIFEASFIHDSYACRKGKGTLAAVDRAQYFAKRFKYVLKADVRKFFPSIDHDVLKSLIARKIKDPDVQQLANQIIDHSTPQESMLRWFPGDDLFSPMERRQGIPIGNQTSQFFANVYLDPLDHFVKDRLQIEGYVRYVDDFLLFNDDKHILGKARTEIAAFLATLRLRLHPKKNVVFPVTQGIRFLGYRVFPTHRLVVKENVWRFLRRVKRMQSDYRDGKTSFAQIQKRITSWSAHAAHADTYRLRQRLFDMITFQRASTE